VENRLPHTQHCTWLFWGLGTFVVFCTGLFVVALLVVVLLVVVLLVVVLLVVVLLVVVLLVVVFLVVVLRVVVPCVFEGTVSVVVVNFIGHETWLHLLLSLFPPLHGLPPPVSCCCTLLILTCSPPPQDSEHSLHSP